MKLWIEFLLFDESESSNYASKVIPHDLFLEFCQLWPESRQRSVRGINVREPADSPRLKEMFAFLEEKTGKVPNWDKFRPVLNDPARFQVHGFREFDPEEVEQADYCVVVPLQRVVVEGERLSGRRLRVKRADILRCPFGGNSWRSQEMLCTGSTRRLLEAESFVNLTFQEVEVIGKKPPVEALWRLDGERALPPVLNKLVNQYGDSVVREDPGWWRDGEFVGTREQLRALGCWAEDFYYPAVLRFDQAKVQRELGVFDVAPTAEGWKGGSVATRQPYLICSRRFREFCMKQRWKLEWWPVELVD